MSIVKELQRCEGVKSMCEQEGFDYWFDGDSIVLKDKEDIYPSFRAYTAHEAYAFFVGYNYSQHKYKTKEWS